jgi:hypothetical protein
MTRAEMRESLALLPSWVLAQKAAANRQLIAVMRQRLAAGEQVARMYQEPGRAWLERQAEANKARASSTGSSSTAALLARPIAAGEMSPAHLAPRFDASLCRLPPSRRARQYQDSHADALGGVNRLTVVLRPRRHPWFVEVGAR